MKLKMKLLILWGFTSFQAGGGGVLKNNIYEELPKKGGLDTLQGDWQKIGRRVFLWGS